MCMYTTTLRSELSANSEMFVIFINACVVSLHVGFPDVWSLAKVTPSSVLLDIWKFQSSGQSPLFMLTTFLGLKRTHAETQTYGILRKSEDTFSVIKKRALKKKKIYFSYWRAIVDECKIPLWASQNLHHISFCFIMPLFMMSTLPKQTHLVTSFLPFSLWKLFWVSHFDTHAYISMSITCPVLLAFSFPMAL